jgi:hypothetical protein
MDNTIKNPSTAIAYLFAVTSAAATFSLTIFVSETFNILFGTGLESATLFDTWIKFQNLVFMTLVFFIVGWFFCLLTAFIPFAWGVLLGRYFKVSHWLYFVIGATVTAAVIGMLILAIPPLGINAVSDDEPSFFQNYMTALPRFLVSGIAAEICCYLVLCKRFQSGGSL